jgi:hypothetical protein
MTGQSPSGGPRLVQLRFCPGFSGTGWQLPLPPAAERALIGWKLASPPVDAGVPPPVARVLATALCQLGTVTFPARLRRPRWRSTRDPTEVAAGVFEGDLFSWDLQGQVVALSPPGTSPRLNDDHLDVGIDPLLFGELETLGATGLLLPGVDGDVAGLYTFSPRAMRALEDALASAARDAGSELITVEEAAFIRLL